MHRIIKYIRRALGEIKILIEKKETGMAFALLADCQEAAIAISSIVGASAGESKADVEGSLEKYYGLLYVLGEEIRSESDNVPKSMDERLSETLVQVRSSIVSIPEQIEAVFLPYKASMWDAMESIWMAADADSYCDTYVIPIPYFDRNPDRSFSKLNYEIDKYPEYVPVVNYLEFDLEKHHPDMIFIHNPYDEYNYVTSVHPDYYSSKLKNVTECLVYVPYFATSGKMDEVQSFLPSYLNADYIVIQSEKHREYFDELIPDKKFLPFGSPKKLALMFWLMQLKAMFPL